MKTTRIVAILLIGILLVFSACTSPSVSPTIPPPTSSPTQQATIPQGTSPETQTPTPTSASSPTSTLSVYFIDVGQGDSILVDLGETEILIDGGEKSPGVSEYIRPYIDGPLDV